MGLCIQERRIRVMRCFKTLFFIITMLISLILFSDQIVLIIADTLLPSALLSASLYNIQDISSHISNYDFRFSLIDIPLISIFRSAVILCVYSLCDSRSLSRGPYFGVATICSVCSLVFVSLKACYVFGDHSCNSMEMALFVCSWTLAVAHVVVAYKIGCRERRKQILVYNIDIEAVSACKIGSFSRYPRVLQDERIK